MPRVGNSYLTESVVILIRWRVCIGKHEAVSYGKIVNPQICKRNPVLQVK